MVKYWGGLSEDVLTSLEASIRHLSVSIREHSMDRGRADLLRAHITTFFHDL